MGHSSQSAQAADQPGDVLARGGGAPSQREVAGHAEADVMMTSQVLRTLEKRGLVTRSPDPADARVKRLAVTPDGARLARRAQTAVEKADRAFFEGATDQPALLQHLRQLAGWSDPPAG